MKQFAKTEIDYVCSHFKNRSAGSEAELECQKHFALLMNNWADKVTTEYFTVHPKAFLGWICISAILSMVSSLLFFFGIKKSKAALLWSCLLGITVALLLYWFEFIKYRKFVDFLFSKKTSCNVYAQRLSRQAPRRRIIFTAHADAAYEFTYVRKANGRFAIPLIIIATIGMALLCCSTAVLLAVIIITDAVVIHVGWQILGACTLLFVPFYFALIFFVNWRCVTDGANDNISACCAAMGVLKHMNDNNLRFDSTEVCCLITGSEESGLRGAAEFAKRHKGELESVETVLISLDTLRDIEKLQIYTKGMSGTQKMSPIVGKLVEDAAKSIGCHLTYADIYPGAVDGDAFAREGLSACGLCAVDHHPKPYYHTRMDTSDNVSLECIELCTNICIEIVNQFDR